MKFNLNIFSFSWENCVIFELIYVFNFRLADDLQSSQRRISSSVIVLLFFFRDLLFCAFSGKFTSFLNSDNAFLSCADPTNGRLESKHVQPIMQSRNL